MTIQFSILLSTIFIFSILQIGCEDDPPIPPDNKPSLGKRDYTWTMDTIAYPNNFQTLMSDISGSSPNDVYVVGHSDGSSAATMFRFDGIQWNTTKFHTREGGPITGSITLDCIHLFSDNDVWAVGTSYFEYPINSGKYIDSSIILHYNGTGWHEHKAASGRGLLTVWGTDSNNVWVGGLWGTLFNKNGSVVSKYDHPSDYTVKHISGSSSNNIYSLSYLQSQQPGNNSTLIHYFDGFTWSKIDSALPFPAQSAYGEASLSVSRSGRVFTTGVGGVFERDSSKWKNILYTGDRIISEVFFESDNNIFAVGVGMVYHFNGDDWFKYEQFSNNDIAWRGVWSDGSEVYIVGYTFGGTKTIVIHGK